MQSELFREIIKAIEVPTMQAGNSVYVKKAENLLSQGDESLMRVICYEENKYEGQEDEFQNKLEGIYKKINNLYDESGYYQKLHQDSGFHYYWRSAKLDTLEVKITDNHLYVIEFQSGQY